MNLIILKLGYNETCISIVIMSWYLDYMVVNIYDIHVNIVHFNLKIH